jgi:hypothetical protein
MLVILLPIVLAFVIWYTQPLPGTGAAVKFLHWFIIVASVVLLLLVFL